VPSTFVQLHCLYVGRIKQPSSDMANDKPFECTEPGCGMVSKYIFCSGVHEIFCPDVVHAYL
jgi:hypothetical protein